LQSVTFLVFSLDHKTILSVFQSRGR